METPTNLSTLEILFQKLDKFLKNYKILDVNYNQNIKLNFMLVDKNFKAFKSAFEKLIEVVLHINEKLNIDNITSLVYEKIINNKIFIVFGVEHNLKLTKVDFGSLGFINLVLTRESDNIISLKQDEKDTLLLDFNRILFQVRNGQGMQVFPATQVVNEGRKVFFTFSTDVRQQLSFLMF